MTRCRDIESRLSLYLDDDLDGPDAMLVRTHVATCPQCAGVLADLKRMADAARDLGPIAPPPFLRARIADTLQEPAADGAPAPAWRGQHWAAAAAVLVAATGLAAVGGWLPLSHGRSATAPPASGLAAVASELELAMHHYERAIAELEVVAAGGEGLSPDVADSIRASLGTLDRAIAESRQVLVADPANELARLSLFEALRRKVDLLQTTVLMVGEVDQNPAGTLITVGMRGDS